MKNDLILPKPADIRAARANLNWKQMDLAYKCGVSIPIITAIEMEKSKPTKELLEKIAQVFMEEGIYFLPKGGYQVEKRIVKFYDGTSAFARVLEDVLKVCVLEKCELLLLGDDDFRSSDEVNGVYKKIYSAGIPLKYLIAKENDYIVGPIEEYKQIDPELFLSKDVVLIYGDKIMFFTEIEGNLKTYELTKVKIIVIENAGMAEQFRAYFYRLWEKGKKPTKSSVKQILFRNKEVKGGVRRKSAE
jgi:transcriptional regulator with XRE-family HTH domain